jgi:chemotaxis protein CheX
MINQAILAHLNTTPEQLMADLDADVREIFSTMVAVELPGAAPTETVTKFAESVTAMIGLAGRYNGVLSVTAPQKLAMYFASQMLGMEITECDDDVRDALGEIANMVGGSFKHHFVNDGHEVRLSTPSVMWGEEYNLNAGALPDTMTLMFPCLEEHFLVSIYLEVGD